MPPEKPYVRVNGKDPQGTPYNYKDLCKSSPLSEDQVDTILANSTVIQNLITPLSNDTPLIDVGAGDPGSNTEVSRSDHVHPIIADATTSSKGKVELANSGENAANVVVQGNDSRINVLTTKGDIYAYSSAPVRLPVGVDNSVLVSDASQTIGLHWMVWQSFWFGSGIDGSSTLASNTTLTTRLSYCRNYTTLDLVTFTITCNSSDRMSIYCCSVLLTGNGGSILAGDAAPGGTGGAARVQGGSSGAGGNGGVGKSGLQVFARKCSGTLTINGNGGAATNGGNASGTPTGIQTGADSGTSLSDNYFCAATIQSGTSTVARGGGAGGGAAGGASTPQTISEVQSCLMDVGRYFMAARGAGIVNEALGTSWMRIIRTVPGNGGGSGGITNSTAASGGGGSGGTYSQVNVAGPAGTAGGAGGGTIGAGGGGGGSGASGTYVAVMIGEFAASSNLTVSANGGNGGNGGNGVSNGGGGSGGSGGTGGVVMCIFPTNYTSVTTSVTATGGTKGTKGTKAGLGTDGGDGTNGTGGTTVIMTWYG